jgi:hypothetical protein
MAVIPPGIIGRRLNTASGIGPAGKSGDGKSQSNPVGVTNIPLSDYGPSRHDTVMETGPGGNHSFRYCDNITYMAAKAVLG